MNNDKVIRYVNGVPTLVSPKLEVSCSNTRLVEIKKILKEMEK